MSGSAAPPPDRDLPPAGDEDDRVRRARYALGRSQEEMEELLSHGGSLSDAVRMARALGCWTRVECALEHLLAYVDDLPRPES